MFDKRNRNWTTQGSHESFQLCIIWKLIACRENKEEWVIAYEPVLQFKSADQTDSIVEQVDRVDVACYKCGFH